MSDLREQTEALLEAMEWERVGTRLNIWAPRPDTDPQAGVMAGAPSFRWAFRFLIPWATARGWGVNITRMRTGRIGNERENCWVEVSGDDGEHEVIEEGADLDWGHGGPDRTVEAIVSALYQALEASRDAN